MFADNINTEMYFETYNDLQDDDAEIFPGWIEDWNGFLWYCEDYLLNWEYYGQAWEDSSLTLIAKNGQVFYSDRYEKLSDFMKAVRPFNKNHFAAAIMNNDGFEYFWINGWDGLQKLQEYTGWFDMEIYYDWI